MNGEKEAILEINKACWAAVARGEIHPRDRAAVEAKAIAQLKSAGVVSVCGVEVRS